MKLLSSSDIWGTNVPKLRFMIDRQAFSKHDYPVMSEVEKCCYYTSIIRNNFRNCLFVCFIHVSF